MKAKKKYFADRVIMEAQLEALVLSFHDAVKVVLADSAIFEARVEAFWLLPIFLEP